MRSIINRISLPAFSGLFVILAMTGVVSCHAQSPTVLRRESPLRFQRQVIRGITARIPDSAPFGFMCDLDGELMAGDWKTTGTVTSVDHAAGVILFKTETYVVNGEVRDPGRYGRLAYRLPHRLRLPLSEGAPITIMHNHEANEKRVERDLHISSGSKLIFATAHQHDDTPPKSADKAEILFPDLPGGHALFFWANPSDNDLVQDLKDLREPQSPVSISIRENQKEKSVMAGSDSITTLQLSGQNYLFVVLSSVHVEHEEGESHSLDCFIVKAAE